MNGGNLKSILTSMGDDGKEVAAFLRKRKIKGIKGNPQYCPVGMYLRRMFPDEGTISVCELDFQNRVRVGRTAIKSPPQINEFVEKFDDLQFKDLIKKGV